MLKQRIITAAVLAAVFFAALFGLSSRHFSLFCLLLLAAIAAVAAGGKIDPNRGLAGTIARRFLATMALAAALAGRIPAVIAVLISDRGAAPALERVDERRLRIVRQMIAGGVQTVPTSSCGRLFDAVSAILDICFENRYEAEAAMELEAAACSAAPDLGSFGFDLSHDEIDLRQTFRDITTAVRNREPIPAISAKFHSTLARAIGAACSGVRARDQRVRADVQRNAKPFP